jgi:hypothetical protein
MRDLGSIRRSLWTLAARRAALRGSSGGAVPADRAHFAREVGIEPDAWQAQLLGSAAPRILMNCCRQSGKSTLAALCALHQALRRPRSLALILAPSERQARETFSKAMSFYRTLRYPVPADSHRKMGVELMNGSRIESLPGKERTVRGFSGVDLLVVDEAARIDNDLYFAIRPMLAVSGGAMLMLSTPYGKRGVFYDAWTKGGPEWERYEVRAPDCPRISPAFLEEERRSLPDWIYRQEYFCEFTETDEQVFPLSLVEGAVTSEVEPLDIF